MPLLKFLPCLLLVVLWLGSVQRVTACSCMPTHPQTAFCRSDFTAVVRVRGVRDVDDTSVEYKVKFHKVFKTSEKFENVREQGTLWTGSNSAMCGVDLEVGVSYVISGNVYDDKARVSLCNVIRPWSTVTSRQRKAYRQFYHYHCGCEVTYTSWSRKGAVYDSIGGKQCLWESMPGPQQCQEEYGVCIKGPAGCTWKPTVAYKTCIKEHQLNRDSQRQKEP